MFYQLGLVLEGALLKCFILFIYCAATMHCNNTSISTLFSSCGDKT